VLLTWPLEPTNEWYAIAKIAGLKLYQAYRPQHGCEFRLRHADRPISTGPVTTSISQELVRVDPRYFRPTEIDELIGDANKARQALGWAPETAFTELVAKMIKSDLKTVAAETGRNDRVAC
jgi:hypothetical protein